MNWDETERKRRDLWEVSWLSQGSVSLSTQHVLITSVSDRTAYTRSSRALCPSQLGNWWAPLWMRMKAKGKRGMRGCVCVCVAFSVYLGGQSIDSAGESVVTCKQGREGLYNPEDCLLMLVCVRAPETKCVSTGRNSLNISVQRPVPLCFKPWNHEETKPFRPREADGYVAVTSYN